MGHQDELPPCLKKCTKQTLCLGNLWSLFLEKKAPAECHRKESWGVSILFGAPMNE